MEKAKEIAVEAIVVGEHELRMAGDDEGIDELAASIRRVGIICPLVVRVSGDLFVLVAGHRRLQAAKKAGVVTVPCVVASTERNLDTEVSFAENLFRKDLTPIEMAAGLKDCLEAGTVEIEALAVGVHRTVEWVRRMIAMLDWPADVLEVVHNGMLSVSAASNLAVVNDDVYRAFLLRNAAESGATARTTAAWLQAWRSMQPAEKAIEAEPVSMGTHQTPMVPQAPCICCSDVFRTDELSHVPVCVHCIKAIREIGARG